MENHLNGQQISTQPLLTDVQLCCSPAQVHIYQVAIGAHSERFLLRELGEWMLGFMPHTRWLLQHCIQLREHWICEAIGSSNSHFCA